MKNLTFIIIALLGAGLTITSATTVEQQSNNNGGGGGLRKLNNNEEPKKEIGGDGEVGGSFQGCFSSETTVEVLHKGPKPMKDLQRGDQILTKSGYYESVYAFGHYDVTTKAQFLQIYTTQQNSNYTNMNNIAPLEITGEHLIYLQGKRNPVRADSIKVGDILVSQQPQPQDTPAVITKISTIERIGLYAPLTQSGNLIVNGLKTSAYISLQDSGIEYGMFNNKNGQTPHASIFAQHDFIHWTFSIFRIMCMNNEAYCESYNDNGYLHFVTNGIALLKYCDTLPTVFQLVVVMMAFAIVGTSYIIESMVGPMLAPYIIMGIILSYTIHKTLNIRTIGGTHSKKMKSL